MSETISGVQAPEEAKENENKKDRLSQEQWEEVRFAYETGQKRVAALAQEYGVSPQAIHQFFKRKKIVFGSRKTDLEEKVVEKAAEKVVAATFGSKRITRIEETKEQAYQSAQAIAALNMRILAECARAGGPTLQSRANDVKTLRSMAVVLKETLDVRYRVLNADENIDPDDLPELQILDLTEEDIAHVREADEEDGEIDVPDVEIDDAILEESPL